MMKEMGLEDYLALRYPYELVEDAVHGGYVVHHPDLEGCMSQGETPDEAVANLNEARQRWIESRHGLGLAIPLPQSEALSGRVTVRMDPSLHGRLMRLAKRKDISLNLLLNTILSQYTGRVEGVNAVQSYPPLYPKTTGMVVAQPAVLERRTPVLSPPSEPFSQRWQGRFRPTGKRDARYRALAEKYL